MFYFKINIQKFYYIVLAKIYNLKYAETINTSTL